MRRIHGVGILIFAVLLPCAVALSQQAPPTSANPSGFNVEAAVNAYLTSLPPGARARSNAYFEGGYWLILWDFLYGAAVAWILLSLGLSAKMRDVDERVTRFKPLQTFLYWIEFLVITTVLTFPLTVYEEFLRERKYGLMNQTFGDGLVTR
jgi:STE24 endopeptidase